MIAGHTNTYGELKQRSDTLAARLDACSCQRTRPSNYGGQTFVYDGDLLRNRQEWARLAPIDTHSPLERLPPLMRLPNSAAIAVARYHDFR